MTWRYIYVALASMLIAGVAAPLPTYAGHAGGAAYAVSGRTAVVAPPTSVAIIGPSRTGGAAGSPASVPASSLLATDTIAGGTADAAPACAPQFGTASDARLGRTPPPILSANDVEAAMGFLARSGAGQSNLDGPCTAAALAELTPEQLVDAVADAPDCVDGMWNFDATVAVGISAANVAAVSARIAIYADDVSAHAVELARLLYYLRMAFYHAFYQPTFSYTPETKDAAGAAVASVGDAPDFFDETPEVLNVRMHWIVTIDNADAPHLALDTIQALLEHYAAEPARKLDWTERFIAFHCSFSLARQVSNAYHSLGDESHWLGLITDDLVAALTAIALDLDYTTDSGPVTENAIFALANFSYLEPEIAEAAHETLTTAYETFPEYSGPWFRALVDLEYFFGATLADGTELDLDTLRQEVAAFALPNTFSLDQGRLLVRTAIDFETVLSLYDAIKEVDAQFFRKTTFLDPVPGDVNESLTLVIYASPPDYWRFQPFLYGLPTNNGGIFIESQATFYTYQRTPADSIYTLEELLRHEYVHYVTSRYVIPGSFGEPGSLYDDGRMTWFDEGFAEFMVGSTRLLGVLPRANLLGLIDEDVSRMSIAEVLDAAYGNGFTFYRYSWMLFYYLNLEHPERFIALFDGVRSGDKATVDALWAALAADAELQSGYDAYLDELIAEARGEGASGNVTFAEDVPTTRTPEVLPENNADEVLADLFEVLPGLSPGFVVWPGRFRYQDRLIISAPGATQAESRALLASRADDILGDLEPGGVNFASAVAWFGDVKLTSGGARATVVVEGPFLATSADVDAPAKPTGLTAEEGIGAVTLTWAANIETDLAGYLVYRSQSPDGPFTPITAQAKRENTLKDDDLEPGVALYYYAVAAVDASGNESELSEIARGAPATHVLIVNGYFDPTITYVDAYARALDALGYGYDVWDPFVQGELPQGLLDAYTDGVVIWAVGYAFGGHETQLGPERRALLEAYLDAGGSLILSGAYVSAYYSDTPLLSDYLGVAGAGNGPGVTTLVSYSYGPLAGDGLEMGLTIYQSEVTVSEPGETAFVFEGGDGTKAAISLVESGQAGGDTGPGDALDGPGADSEAAEGSGYDAVFLAFPFADLTLDSRLALLERVMAWLAPPAPVAGDANGDGAVTATDALAVLRGSLGTGVCTMCVCDVSGDGSLTAVDALMVLQRAVGRSVSLSPPVC